MPRPETTLTEFIIGEQRRFPGATGGFTALVNDIRLACKRIGTIVGKGALAGLQGRAGARNVQGEEQEKLDVVANDIFLRTNEWGGTVAAMVSEEMDAPYLVPTPYPRGRYLLAFDPLDGSSNIDVNVSVGSIFSVLRAPEGAAEPTLQDFLQPGARQVCAGYAIYGPTTMLVLTFGTGIGSALIVDGQLVRIIEVGQVELNGVRPAEKRYSAKARRAENLEWDEWGKRAREFIVLVDEVFTPDLIETWISYKRENEIDPIRLRPTPHEFDLYYEV